MKVSIALATYNGAEYLEDQLESFSRQTHLPDELVASDDGSADDTLLILESFMRRAPFPVRILRNATPLGVRANFSKAIGGCRGEYIFLSDQDDVWFSNKICHMIEVAEEQPDSHVFICDARFGNKDLSKLYGTKLEYVRRITLNRSASHRMGCCTMITGEFAELATPIPRIPSNHDSWLKELACYVGGTTVVEAVLQFYRRHTRNQSSEPIRAVGPTAQHQTWRRICQSDVHKIYRKEAELSQAVRSRLHERREKLQHLMGPAGVSGALRSVEAKLAAARQRQEVIRMGRLRRLPKVMIMLSGGQYRHFKGLRSFIRDCAV